MTRNQAELLQFIRSFQDMNGYTPSLEEMKDGLNKSSRSMVHRMLKGLEEQGRIKRLRQRARAIEIVENPAFRPDLASFTKYELARELKLRGFTVGHIHRDATGKRTFKEITV